jgi:hypothetical protein
MSVFETDRLLDYGDEALLAEVRRVAALVPDPVLSRARFDAQARVCSATVAQRFGGWAAALAKAGLAARYSGVTVTEKHRRRVSRGMSDGELLDELRRLAARLRRRRLAKSDVERHTPVGANVYLRRFGSWTAALRRAGLAPVKYAERFDERALLDNLREVWLALGRCPTAEDMRHPPSLASARTYQNRFGTWRKALAAFLADANSGNPEASDPTRRVWRAPRPRAVGRRRVPARTGAASRTVALGLRFAVFERDRFRCVACGRSPSAHPELSLHADHVVPWSAGGKTTLENLRTLCADCNLGRGAGRK